MARSDPKKVIANANEIRFHNAFSVITPIHDIEEIDAAFKDAIDTCRTAGQNWTSSRANTESERVRERDLERERMRPSRTPTPFHALFPLETRCRQVRTPLPLLHIVIHPLSSLGIWHAAFVVLMDAVLGAASPTIRATAPPPSPVSPLPLSFASLPFTCTSSSLHIAPQRVSVDRKWRLKFRSPLRELPSSPSHALHSSSF